MKKYFAMSAAVLTIAMASAGAMAAGTTSTTFEARLVIKADCMFNSTAPQALDFGTVPLLDTAIDGTTELAVTCSKTTPYKINLNAGTATGSTVAQRLLKGAGVETVNYNIYKDNAHTQVWGETAADSQAGVGTGAEQKFTLYGQAPVQATPAPDTYVSTLTATLEF